MTTEKRDEAKGAPAERRVIQMACHEFSIETLYHFKCCECSKWWSIGDWEKCEKITCPHCGIMSYVSVIEDDV